MDLSSGLHENKDLQILVIESVFVYKSRLKMWNKVELTKSKNEFHCYSMASIFKVIHKKTEKNTCVRPQNTRHKMNGTDGTRTGNGNGNET